MCWTVLVRCPIPVNICGRVSTSFTGRPAVRAASAARPRGGQPRSPAPNPPPTNGASTRTPLSGTPKAAASVARKLWGHWGASDLHVSADVAIAANGAGREPWQPSAPCGTAPQRGGAAGGLIARLGADGRGRQPNGLALSAALAGADGEDWGDGPVS